MEELGDAADERPLDEAVIARVDAEAVSDALARLTEEQQSVIQLRFVWDMSIAETAAALGKSEGAVKAMQHRALRAMASPWWCQATSKPARLHGAPDISTKPCSSCASSSAASPRPCAASQAARLCGPISSGEPAARKASRHGPVATAAPGAAQRASTTAKRCNNRNICLMFIARHLSRLPRRTSIAEPAPTRRSP